jgi:hypothetical protein
MQISGDEKETPFASGRRPVAEFSVVGAWLADPGWIRTSKNPNYLFISAKNVNMDICIRIRFNIDVRWMFSTPIFNIYPNYSTKIRHIYPEK